MSTKLYRNKGVHQSHCTEKFKYTYIHLLIMATKTITITNGAYEKLFAFKENNESFSEVIDKLTGRYSLLELVGVLSKNEASELRATIKEVRTRLRKQVEKTVAKFK